MMQVYLDSLLVGYAMDHSFLWRGHVWRRPQLATYTQWRDHLLSVEEPRIYLDDALLTGEAFLQWMQAKYTDETMHMLSPAHFRGRMYRRDGVHQFIDEDLGVKHVRPEQSHR